MSEPIGLRTLASGSSLGRYKLLRLLGSGAMGDVFLAEDPQIERQLAIKTVRVAEGKPLDVEDRKRRLLREAKAAGRLIHPHVVTLFDAGEADGQLYLAFEFVSGTDLGKRLEEGPALSIGEALRMARETADALDFAHKQGIVHRDIKPANLLLDQNGRVKVADFGIAKVVGQSTELTMEGSVVGSPHYLSPEQVRGEQLDGRTDIYSLGVVVYEMFGKQRPFQGETLTTLVYQILHQEPPPVPCARPDLAPRLAQLLGKMLAKDRDLRFASAGALVAEIAALERELPPEVLMLPASADAETFEGTRKLASVPAPASSGPSASAVLASAPTMAPGPAAPTAVRPTAPGATPPAIPPPAAVSSIGATVPAARPRRSALPVVLVGLFVLLAGAGTAGWWIFLRKPAPPPPLQQTPVTAVSPATQPSAPPRTAPAPVPPTAVPTPSSTPPSTRPSTPNTEPQREPVPTTQPQPAPVRTEPATQLAPSRPSPPPSREPAPIRSEPAQPVQTAPVTPPRPAPAPEPEEPAPTRRAFDFDREMTTGTAISFKVLPEDAVVKVRAVDEQRGISIGRAGDYTGKGREGKTYGLPEGPGDYVITITYEGVEHVVLAHAEAGRPATQIVYTFAGSGKRRRGD